MREMRLAKREVKDPELLRQIVEDCDVLRLGLMDEEGMFIVPVNFGYCMEHSVFQIYFHSAVAGRKVDAIRTNPQAAFEMDCGHQLITGDYSCTYSYAYRSIMGTGVIRQLENPEEKIQGLRLIMKHTAAPEHMAFREEALKRTLVYCMEVTSYTGKMREQK